jgi:Tfp pilus assembly protein PilO
MKNLPKEKRDRLIFVTLLTLGTVAAIYYFVIKAQRTTLQNLSAQITEHKEKVANAERLIASVPLAKSNLETSRRRLSTIEEGMASGDMYSWVIQTVGRFGAERKVDIPQFSREVTGEIGMFPKFPYKAAIFNVRGHAFYHDLGKFLADFENQFPYARVQNLELEPAAGSAANAGADPEKLSFRLEIVTLINPNVH